ncbi:MAG TPA: hypothetical protein VFZ68_13290 [Acidimicrobiales bacterium]
MAQARARIEHDTDGLAPDAAIERLEATVARTEAEASRLGIRIPGPEADDPADLGDGEGPVVIVRRLIDPGETD